MNGWYKLTESFTIADLAKRLEYVTSNDRIKGQIILNLVRENLQLKDDIAEQAGDIRLLFDCLCEPEEPRWHKYGLAFAAGVVFMAVIASALVLL